MGSSRCALHLKDAGAISFDAVSKFLKRSRTTDSLVGERHRSSNRRSDVCIYVYKIMSEVEVAFTVIKDICSLKLDYCHFLVCIIIKSSQLLFAALL